MREYLFSIENCPITLTSVAKRWTSVLPKKVLSRSWSFSNHDLASSDISETESVFNEKAIANDDKLKKS